MITREKILKLMHQHLGEIQERYAVRRIGLFGSHVRNDAGSESDIDILVDFFSPPLITTWTSSTIWKIFSTPLSISL